MKAYKGFNKDLRCKGFQYELGKSYEEKGAAQLCAHGFHACESPLDVFSYYPPGNGSRYCEVELIDPTDKKDSDSKRVANKIAIGAEIGAPGLARAHIEYVKAHTTSEYTDPEKATAGEYGAATAGDCGAATAGDCGAATAGNRGAATAGNGGAATAGDCGAATAGYGGAATAGYAGAATAGNRGAATAGNRGAATAGNRGAATAGYAGAATAGNGGAATAGNRGAATAGNCGAATAGNRGAATAGNRGAATSRGCSAVGAQGIACARGNGVKVKGGLGSVLVLVEENPNNYSIAAWKAVEVDGEKIKPDTWYGLRNGEVVEIEE